MAEIFNFIFYQPTFNLLFFIYVNLAFNDFGIAIIFLTLFIRILLFPLFHKSFKYQAAMSRLQPEMEKIKHNHKDNKEKQAAALMALYKQRGVNPLSGFFFILIQLPIFVAIYQVVLNSLKESLFSTHYLLNIIDLSQRSFLIIGLALAAQYWQSRQSMPSSSSGLSFPANYFMIFFGLFLTALLLFNMPSAIGLYWLATTFFSVIQQYFINKKLALEKIAIKD